MHYLHFEDFLNRLETLVNCIGTVGVQTPRRGIFLTFITLFNIMYLSDPLWKKKVFDFNYIFISNVSDLGPSDCC
jgi:hypothetical protein